MELLSQPTLQVGKAYIARSKCDPITDSNGIVHSFAAQTFRIRVYPKPFFVVPEDTPHPIPLPTHLDGCYYVKNLMTDRFMWFYVDQFYISDT